MKINLRSADTFKWLGVFLLIVAIVGGNVYYSDTALAIRVTVMILVGIAAIALALQTAKGKLAFSFIKESKLELRKVVWPTRPETIQTTLMIGGIVLLMALVFWGFDSLFAYIVGNLLI